MALKPLECPNCHGLIETFDETTKKGFCPFCDAVVADVPSLQDAYEVKIAGPVSVEGIEGASQLLERIDGFILLGDESRALSLLDEFTDKYPADFRGWNKRFELAIQDGVDELPGDNLIRYAKNMAVLAKTADEKNSVRKARATLESMKDELNQRINKLQSEIDNHNDSILSLSSELDNVRDQANSSGAILSEKTKERETARENLNNKKAINTKSEITLKDFAVGFGTIGFIGGAIFLFVFDKGQTALPLLILFGIPFYGCIGAIIGVAIGVIIGGTINAIIEKTNSDQKNKEVVDAEGTYESVSSTFEQAKELHDADNKKLRDLQSKKKDIQSELAHLNESRVDNKMKKTLVVRAINALASD